MTINQKRSHLWASCCNVWWRWEQVRALPPPHKPLRNNRELTQRRRRRRQRERQRSNRFRQAKQQLCTCITLFMYISLPSLHDYNVKLPNLTFCRGRGTEDNDFFFFFWTLMQSFRFQLLTRIKRDGINAIKFEAAQIHFFSDVFVAVAVVVSWNK